MLFENIDCVCVYSPEDTIRLCSGCSVCGYLFRELYHTWAPETSLKGSSEPAALCPVCLSMLVFGNTSCIFTFRKEVCKEVAPALFCVKMSIKPFVYRMKSEIRFTIPRLHAFTGVCVCVCVGVRVISPVRGLFVTLCTNKFKGQARQPINMVIRHEEHGDLFFYFSNSLFIKVYRAQNELYATTGKVLYVLYLYNICMSLPVEVQLFQLFVSHARWVCCRNMIFFLLCRFFWFNETKK